MLAAKIRAMQRIIQMRQSLLVLTRKLDSAKLSFSTAFNQLYSGRGNLIKKAKDFERLGVSVQKALPSHLVEKAELELDYLPHITEEETGEAGLK